MLVLVSTFSTVARFLCLHDNITTVLSLDLGETPKYETGPAGYDT